MPPTTALPDEAGLISIKHSENATNLLKHIASFNNSITDNTNFVNTYKIIFDGLNLTTKALVAANLADEALKEYGLSQGLDAKQASSLLNMTMNTGTTMKMGDNITMASRPTIQALNLANKQVIDQANFDTSASYNDPFLFVTSQWCLKELLDPESLRSH